MLYYFFFLWEQIYKNKKARVGRKNKDKWRNWLKVQSLVAL